MRSLPLTLAVLVAALAVSVALAGCGDDPLTKANAGKVRSVVLRFAAADDASACDLLTADALRNVYGGFNARVPKARAACVRRSARFRGAPIKIVKLALIDNVTAKVNALSSDGKFTYSVTVRRPGKRWLIDQITLHKVR
jgi:ABC-type oligopeptide transport system substrate-binding subunit